MTDRSLPAVHLHIGGEKRSVGSGGSHTHIYPADGSATGTIPLAGERETEEAVAAASAAFANWRRTDPRQRGELLRREADMAGLAEFLRCKTVGIVPPAA